MADLLVKDIEDDFYEQLKRLAAAENRSLSQQVLFILREHLARRKHQRGIIAPGEALLELAGSWIDDRDADEIVSDLRASRRPSSAGTTPKMTFRR